MWGLEDLVLKGSTSNYYINTFRGADWDFVSIPTLSH